MTNRDHLVPLPGAGDWALWRTVCLRSAGFPVKLLLALGAPHLASLAQRLAEADAAERRARSDAVDVLLQVLRETTPGPLREGIVKLRRTVARGGTPMAPPDAKAEVVSALHAVATSVSQAGELRADYDRAFRAFRVQASETLRAIAREPRFREAVTWQNRQAVHTGLDALIRSPASSTRARDRRHEELPVNYLQRYCAKNDSIGFFGPFGWASFVSQGPALRVQPGAALLLSRVVLFEQWAMDAFADAVAKEPGTLRWLFPRRLPFIEIDGNQARSPLKGTIDLSEGDLALLRTCDGRRSAKAIAAAIVHEQPGLFEEEARVLASLERLRDEKIIGLDFAIPMTWKPDTAVAARLSDIGDAVLRERSLARLATLVRAREAVAECAGDPDRLDGAIAELESVFSRETGLPPRRHSGTMYAARQVAFEDTRRDVEVSLGPAFLDALAPAISLVLASARWFGQELARLCEEEFSKAYDVTARRKGAPIVPFADFWFRTQRLLYGTKDRPVDRVAAELRERWSGILITGEGRRLRHTAEALAPRVAASFPARGPGWPSARHHCPDLMIAARDAEAILAGDYEVVLGEVHIATNTFDQSALARSHPHLEELLVAMGRDIPETRVLLVQSKDWPHITVRTARALFLDKDYHLETGLDPAGAPAERTLAMDELRVERRAEGLVVCTHDGRFAMPALQFFGDTLGWLASREFKMLPAQEHTPRITVDRLVVHRESWSVPSRAFPFATESSEPQRFIDARRWAHDLGLPRFVFVRSPIEVKPIYVDLESPHLVNALAKLVRRTMEDPRGRSLEISEMLPAPDQLWLTDAAGERYTSELRVVAVDAAKPRGVSR